MRVLALLSLAFLTGSAAAQTAAKSVAPAPTHSSDFRKTVTDRTTALLDSINTEHDYAAAAKSCASLLDELLATAPATETDAFREADFALRLIRQTAEAPAGKRVEALKYLRANDQLAQTLVFLVRPEDKTKEVYALLERLREAHGDDLNRLASLTAALCVVRDQFNSVHANENKATAADPLAIFEYFRDHEKSMLFPLTKLPPELLLSVVNTTASIEDLNWALKKYGGDPKVGQRYFEVKYDYEHFRKGTPEKITELGFTLPNILAYGGVCVDQSYFAQEVGKAIGVPTTEVTGRNAGVGHAWMGFLESKGDTVRWNFDTGHYAGYRGVRGTVLNPQTNKPMPDSYLSLMAEASLSNAVARRTAVAMTDAALRLAQIQSDSVPFPPTGETIITGHKPMRQADVADRLQLVEAALRKCPTYEPGWEVLIAAASAGELSFADKQRWAKTLDNLCGAKYPDFSFDVLMPMVLSVSDAKEQDALWNSMFASFQKRPDLAAEVRFAQGALWENADNKAKAWDCYQDVVHRFANDGPFTVEAAARCEKLLAASGKDKDITPMYAALWPKLTKPKDAAPEFLSGSNWFRIGLHLADRLENDGGHAKAEEVRLALGVGKKK